MCSLKTASQGSQLSVAEQAVLSRALCDEAILGHPVSRSSIVETHISFVVLTGSYAYKIKKAVDLEFLDFSTREKRWHFCLEELRLNRRTAPQLYLQVIPIGGSIRCPRIGGEPVLEYALKMREFDQNALAANLLATGSLRPGDFEALAEEVATFHVRADRAAPDTAFGTPASALSPALQNFEQLARLLSPGPEQLRLESLSRWTRQQSAELGSTFASRKLDGYVRECHGDLHLGNIVQLDGRLTPFDCIEFNPALRWIDVMNDIAFLLMDLEYRERNRFAARFLNAYLEITGDYAGLHLLDFYKVYRALVRAKVAMMRSRQAGGNTREDLALQEDYAAHIRFAQRCIRPRKAALVITHGLSGSGKTTLSQGLVDLMGAIRIRSDVERKRLYGMDALAPSHSAVGGGLYTQSATQDTYQRLLDLAQALIGYGYCVIVDATFRQRSRREMFRSLAKQLGVPFAIIDFQAPIERLRERLQRRQLAARDASEANVEVLELQLATQEPFAAEELGDVFTVDTRGDIAAAFRIERWRPLIDRLGLPPSGG